MHRIQNRPVNDCTQSCYRWLSAADGTNALPDRSWLRFTTGNVMEERCSFAIHISNITRNTNSFIHDSFGLHSSKEQEIRILSYGVHFIQYRKFQTIQMHSEHMMLNMFRSGIKVSQSTLIIFSKSGYTNFQTIEKQHKLFTTFRSGIKVSTSTLLIFSKSWFYKIPCEKVQRRCHIHGSTEYSLL